MIISISGTPGSGKSTIAKFIARKLHLKLYNVGAFAREIAKAKGISIEELSRLALKNAEIDKEIDKMHKTIKEKSFVIDSRIAFCFFSQSLKVFVYCKPEIAARRIFRAKRPEERMSLRKTIQEVKQRIKTEKMRYRKYYGINIHDLSNYDIIIDTSGLDKRKMNSTAWNALKKFLNSN
jgi:cytidylate kinase